MLASSRPGVTVTVTLEEYLPATIPWDPLLGTPYYTTIFQHNTAVKSSQVHTVVGLRDRVAIIRALLHSGTASCFSCVVKLKNAIPFSSLNPLNFTVDISYFLLKMLLKFIAISC